MANGDLTQTITVDARGRDPRAQAERSTRWSPSCRPSPTRSRAWPARSAPRASSAARPRCRACPGTWRGLTENVNQLAGNLTTQVRAIAEVSTAVAQGDLTRSITVEAQGEVAELKDNINQMIANLRETTQQNAEQDWLKTNLASISGMLQGQRDLATVSQLIMSEVTPTVGAQHGAFFLAERARTAQRAAAGRSYGYTPRRSELRSRFELGESLVARRRSRRRRSCSPTSPPTTSRSGSGLGEAAPADVLVMPVLFEDHVLGGDRAGLLRPFSDVNLTSWSRSPRRSASCSTRSARTMRTEELLGAVARADAGARRRSSQELQAEELRKPTRSSRRRRACAEQNRDIEIKNGRSSSPGAAWRKGRAARAVLASTSRSSWRTCRTSCARR